MNRPSPSPPRAAPPARPASHIGLPDAIPKISAENPAPSSIDFDHHFPLVPLPAHGHHPACEIHCIFYEISEPVDDSGITASDRFRAFAPAGLESKLDRRNRDAARSPPRSARSAAAAP